MLLELSMENKTSHKRGRIQDLSVERDGYINDLLPWPIPKRKRSKISIIPRSNVELHKEKDKDDNFLEQGTMQSIDSDVFTSLPFLPPYVVPGPIPDIEGINNEKSLFTNFFKGIPLY